MQMFNAPDPINSPGDRLPLGYFITRVAATKETCRTGQSHLLTYADDSPLKTLWTAKVPQSVFEGEWLEGGRLHEDTEIGMGREGGQPWWKSNRHLRASTVQERICQPL